MRLVGRWPAVWRRARVVVRWDVWFLKMERATVRECRTAALLWV
jgi:hypothetical protein